MKRGGCILVLAAMGTFALSALFLVFYEGPASALGVTYFEVLRSPGQTSGAVHTIGAILTLFGGPSLIAVLCVLALVGGRRAPASPTIVVAVATWSTFVVGTTLSLISSDLPLSLGSGFWVQIAAAGVALAGALMLLTSRAPGLSAGGLTDQRAVSPS